MKLYDLLYLEISDGIQKYQREFNWELSVNKWSDVKWSDMEWTDVIYVKWFYFEVKWI